MVRNLQPQARLSAFSATTNNDTGPAYEERPLHLIEAGEVFSYLKGLDWSFTDDDTRFMGHDLHPYPAKFIPQLPGTIISLLSSRGEIVFDPFGGSGTTALEAIRLGRMAMSIDANPVAALIGKVKTASVSADGTAELHGLHGWLRTELASLPPNTDALVEKYGQYAPAIPHREKWFPDSSFGELSMIKFRIGEMESQTAKDIALLSLSRTILAVSFQDSETRYKSVPRDILVGETVRRYIKEFESVMKSVARNESATRYGVSHFLTGDARTLMAETIPDGSIDLVVTSPPYGNATDYHLYHRFRLLWLGHAPTELGKIEIGSHLKHQREGSGFESYLADMIKVMETIRRVLKNGRYAVLVIGDSVYDGKTYDTAGLLAAKAEELGFDAACVIERQIHKTKRSFAAAGRRAACEQLLVLRKKTQPTTVILNGPPYKMWPYEETLSTRIVGGETERSGVKHLPNLSIKASLDVAGLARAKKLVFTHGIEHEGGFVEPTWQSILENGTAFCPSARKDPKYVTHGLHAYKGKFYPQLAKCLINLKDMPSGAVVLDPFCGSGTTLLEGYLNGLRSFGCDMNPLAAKIARAKTGILDVEPDLLTEVVANIIESVNNAPTTLPESLDGFSQDCAEEISRWFAVPIARKIHWLLQTIRRGSAGVSMDFLEIVLSGIVRDVSQQEPTDLRIRYRKEMLTDADVFGLFIKNLETQFSRVEKFWKVRGYSPNRFLTSRVEEGDNRLRSTYDGLGLADESVDLVLTSPPYAMALPYIDTDRLSIATICGMSSSNRRPIEQSMTGSRELSVAVRKRAEEEILQGGKLPQTCVDFVQDLHRSVSRSKDAGFRKQNMPALTHRFMNDMDAVCEQLFRLCKPGAEAMVVIGDSKMTIDNKDVRIPSTDFVQQIACNRGFELVERIDISVTTENFVHIKNAITENVILRLRK